MEISDKCSSYIFWLHLLVNKNVDVYFFEWAHNHNHNINKSIDIFLNRIEIISYKFVELSANILSLGMRIHIISYYIIISYHIISYLY